MTNLSLSPVEHQKQSTLALIKANLLGNKNLSIRGLAQLCGVADKSIVNGGSLNSSKLAETLLSHGFEASSLVSDGFDAQATWLVIEYFAYDSKAKAIGAKQLARTFGAFGIHQIFNELSEAQPQAQAQPLPPKRDAVDYIQAGKDLGCIDNPMLRAILEQRLMEDASTGLKVLEAEKMCILTVRAKELGYSDSQIGSGASLGRFVARHIKPVGKQQHGRYPVNTYHVCSELDEVIHAFFR